MTVDILENDLKKQELKSSIYLFYGEERFLLENCVKKIKKFFGNLILGINYIYIDENNINNLISDIQTPAFGYEKKLIIIKRTGLFVKKENNKLTEQINTYINENINEIQQTTVLVFIEEEINKNELAKTIEKNGIICNFERLKPIQIIKRLKGITQAYDANVDEKTLQILIETCGTDMQILINEIRKLIEFVGKGGTIRPKDIEVLCIKQLDYIIFDLTDNLGKKETKKAMEILKGLIYNKEPIQKILITLYNHFKKIYITILCEKTKKDLSKNLELKPNQAFLVSKYKKQATYFNEKEIKQVLKELIKLDENYKKGLIDINIGLEAILCTYCN